MRDPGARRAAAHLVRGVSGLLLVVVLTGPVAEARPATASAAVLAVEATAPHGPEEIRETTDEVLSRRAYRERRPTWIERVRAELRQWFAERLARLLSGTRGSIIGWVVVALATLAAALLGVRLLRSVGSEPERATVTTLRPSARSPEAWWEDVELALVRGDLHEAVRCAYHAVVAQLAIDGVVEDTPGRTLGEQREEVGQNAPALSQRFSVAADRVEAVLYGGAEPERSDVESLRALAPTGAFS